MATVATALHQRDDGAYVGFLTDEDPARVRQAYPGSTWDRLVQVKARYDPTSLSHHNRKHPDNDQQARAVTADRQPAGSVPAAGPPVGGLPVSVLVSFATVQQGS
jgi:hypothetical protein